MKTQAEIIEGFNSRNFHDDTFCSISIFHSHPDRLRKPNKGRVEIVLVGEKKRVLALTGCVNIVFRADFDVMAQNAWYNTSHVKAEVSPSKLKQLILAQKPFWNVGYEPPMNEPIKHKVENLDEYILFKVFLFGGTLEVIAEGFRVKNLRT